MGLAMVVCCGMLWLTLVLVLVFGLVRVRVRVRLCVCVPVCVLGTALEDIAKVWRRRYEANKWGEWVVYYHRHRSSDLKLYRALSLASAVLLQSHNSPESASKHCTEQERVFLVNRCFFSL